MAALHKYQTKHTCLRISHGTPLTGAIFVFLFISLKNRCKKEKKNPAKPQFNLTLSASCLPLGPKLLVHTDLCWCGRLGSLSAVVDTQPTWPHLFSNQEWWEAGFWLPLLVSMVVVGGTPGTGWRRLLWTMWKYWLNTCNVIYPELLEHPFQSPESLIISQNIYYQIFTWRHPASRFSGACVLLNFALFWLIRGRGAWIPFSFVSHLL